MFDSMGFKPIVTRSRGRGGAAPVSITHSSLKDDKESQVYRLLKETMEKCNFSYGDTVQIMFNEEQDVCRIERASNGVKLSKQTANNPNSAAVIKLLYKTESNNPNLLERARKLKDDKELSKAVYVHEEGKIEYKDGQLTFQMKLCD